MQKQTELTIAMRQKISLVNFVENLECEFHVMRKLQGMNIRLTNFWNRYLLKYKGICPYLINLDDDEESDEED